MKKDYWNQYYGKSSKRAAPNIPSQFAVFVANELGEHDPVIIDLGSGNGRDTFFFSKCGFEVVGIDASEEAIRNCTKNELGDKNPHFICSDIAGSDLVDKLMELRADRTTVLYARFFLHAIDEQAEEMFFKLAQSVCGHDGLVAVEFRTEKDAALSKVTGAHYRRFINPIQFLNRANQFGFSSTYFVEGFGHAKFQNDDAHVARALLSPNNSE